MIRAATATALALALAACSMTATKEAPPGAMTLDVATLPTGRTIDNNPTALAWRMSSASLASAGVRPTGLKQAGILADIVTEEIDDTTSLDGAAAEGEPFTLVVNDRYQTLNRGFHDFNRTMDVVMIKPLSDLYGALVPTEIQDMIENALHNLDEPRNFANFVFQGNGGKARDSATRFFVNSTLGIGGLFDVAGQAGIEYEPTDFGMTLARAGVPEGPYFVYPGLGPTTRRDSWASIVDVAFSPTFWYGIAVDEQVNIFSFAVLGATVLDTRYRNSDLIDTVIYASPDSYATEQSIYLQRRRARIRGEFTGDDDEFLPVIP